MLGRIHREMKGKGAHGFRLPLADIWNPLRMKKEFKGGENLPCVQHAIILTP